MHAYIHTYIHTYIHQITSAALRKLRKELYPVPYSRVLHLHRPEWYLLVIGCLVATAHGGVMPAFAFIFSSMLSTYYLCEPFVFPGSITVYGAECIDKMYLEKHLERCTQEGKCLEYLQVGEHVWESMREECLHVACMLYVNLRVCLFL